MYDDRICKEHDRGEHIELTCVNHPYLTWSTKNIAHIGARSVFFDLSHKATEPECSCSASYLRHQCVKLEEMH